MVPQEPPEGFAGVLSVRVRLPNGDRLTRRFHNSERLKSLFNLVGSQECVNPRHFRILLADAAHPREVPRNLDKLMTQEGFSSFSLVIAENVEESDDQQDVPYPLHVASEEVLIPVDDQSETISTGGVNCEVAAVIQTPDDLEKVRSKLRLDYATSRKMSRVKVSCVEIFKSFLDLYTEDPNVTQSELRVKFDGEKGLDGGGLEAFALFWEALEKDYLEGREEKVPICIPRLVNGYFHIGRILSHGYVLTGYFPLCFSKPVVQMLVSGKYQDINEDDLVRSFLKYIDAFEEQSVTECLDGKADPGDSDVIVSMMSRFNYHTKPTSGNFRATLRAMSRFVLLCQPFFAISEIRRGMQHTHPQLWTYCSSTLAESLVYHLRPTCERVWEMFVEPEFSNTSEQTVYDYLRRFIHSLGPEDLAKLMRFITGNPQCGLQVISVSFHTETNVIKRRPTTNTCGMVLHLPTTYTSFATFNDEFKQILQNSSMWLFDSL